jgi:branched-chain amino acid transport system ATP-binding protein
MEMRKEINDPANLSTTSRNPSKEVILELKNVSRSFGGLLAVSNVNLEVEKGEILALIGPNGAGKTTLINIMSGFLSADSGKIFFEGKEINNLAVHERCRMGLARTFQIAQPFFGMRTLENVMVASMSRLTSVRESRNEAMRWIQFLGLSDKIYYPASELTLVEQKKLELLRCLATQPKLLLVDELMTGLTPTESHETIEALKTIRNKGITIIFIEHKMDVVVRLAERIFVLNFGEKIAEGAPNAVMNNPEVIKAYLGESYGVSS